MINSTNKAFSLQKDKIFLNLEKLLSGITSACERCGRSADEVVLMAVTKTQAAAMVELAVEAGLRVIGENRVQEAQLKRSQVRGHARWELIGPLQTNKVKAALAVFDRIQTVDRLSLVERLDGSLEQTARSAYPVLLQVNVGNDPAKHGCTEDAAAGLLEALLQRPRMVVEGLMTIGQFSEDRRVQRKTFAALRKLRDRLQRDFGVALPVLSMGMTADWEVAIEEGSTLLRLGSLFFGER